MTTKLAIMFARVSHNFTALSNHTQTETDLLKPLKTHAMNIRVDDGLPPRRGRHESTVYLERMSICLAILRTPPV